MPIAAECGDGHKRAYSDGAQGTTAPCLVCGLLVLVPPNTVTPCYQTVPLIPLADGAPPAYSPGHDLEALELFQFVRRAMLPLATPPDLFRAWMEKGSYSIKATNTDETVGKIVIYERASGTMTGAPPPQGDGVYVWVRANGIAAGTIWDGNLEAAHPQVFCLLHPASTMGVRRPAGVACSERFVYFLLPPSTATAPVTWAQIAALLAALSQV